MTPHDALTAIHRAQEALANARRAEAPALREPRVNDWILRGGRSSIRWGPLSHVIFRAECAARYAYVGNRHTGASLLRVAEHLECARWSLIKATLEPAQLLLDTAERLLREHLEERRVG